MKIDILTLFPEGFSYFNTSIIKRAREKKLIDINLINIRDYSQDKHNKCDDTPFGGGAGMVMTPQPICDAISSVKSEKSHTVFMSPCGKVLNQKLLKKLAKYEHLIILCGHYEGVDQRVVDTMIDEEISIGDYILTGGELPAMVLADGISRLIPGVLNNADSATVESFEDSLLEAPQYTRPRLFKGIEVPEVLINGNHAEIEKWKKAEGLKLTKKRRKDLLKGVEDED